MVDRFRAEARIGWKTLVRRGPIIKFKVPYKLDNWITPTGYIYIRIVYLAKGYTAFNRFRIIARQWWFEICN